MTARLKAYIRRTILSAAREYAYPRKYRSAKSTASAFRDASHGTNTGWWTALIYNDDVLATFNRYRSDVAAAVRQYLDECGADANQKVTRDDPTTFVDMLAACSRRWSIEDYSAPDNSSRNNGAVAASLAIRFAIEFLVPEVAADCGVEL